MKIKLGGYARVKKRLNRTLTNENKVGRVVRIFISHSVSLEFASGALLHYRSHDLLPVEDLVALVELGAAEKELAMGAYLDGKT